MRKPISQKEARSLRKQVVDLKFILRQQKSAWSSAWVAGWVNIERLSLSPESYAKVMTARKLGHAVVVVPEGNGTNILLYADKL